MRFQRKIAVWLFSPESDDWIAVLRIGLGLEIALYCLGLRREWTFLYSGAERGVIGRQLLEAPAAAASPLVPRLGWIVDAAGHLGIGETAALQIAWWILLASAICLTIGVFSRGSAVVAWFLHLCAVASGGLLSYGVENFVTIGLFYLMLMPLPDRFSLDARWRGAARANFGLNGFWRRVLQLHLCVIYFFGGVAKALGSGWWDGMNLWCALTRTPFNIIPAATIARFAELLPLLGISIWVIELFYPILIWPRRTRTLWLALTCTMHVAIGLLMGMYLFALIMLVLNVAAFGPNQDARAPAADPAAE